MLFFSCEKCIYCFWSVFYKKNTNFITAKLYQSPELIVQAETRFAESPFVLECLEWHNYLRKKHLAPQLDLDPGGSLAFSSDATSKHCMFGAKLSVLKP